jgi:hydroxypyruvate isomerase
LRAALVANDLTFVLLNAPPPNFTGGEPGYAAVPGSEARFRRDFDRTLRYAKVLKPLHIHIMSGPAEGSEALSVYAENLAWAAARAPDQSLTIEPLNATDMPGYFLNNYPLAATVLGRVAAPNLSLQYDAYHAQMMTGDAAAVWAEYGHRARHIQIGSAPGRHEPMGGGVNWQALFDAFDRDGYDGWVSAEYNPRGTTESGLGWLNRP